MNNAIKKIKMPNNEIRDIVPKRLEAKTEAEWQTESFIPENGEVLIYEKDENFDYTRIKIGDGTHSVNELSFFGTQIYVSDVEPDNAPIGAIWIDTSESTVFMSAEEVQI